MTPALSNGEQSDVPFGNFEGMGQCGQRPAFRAPFDYFSHALVGEFREAMRFPAGKKSHTARVPPICHGVTPFQVSYGVVRFAPVKMIDGREMAWVFNEANSNHSMDQNGFLSLAIQCPERNLTISLVGEGSVANAFTVESHASEGRNLYGLESMELKYLPYLFHEVIIT